MDLMKRNRAIDAGEIDDDKYTYKDVRVHRFEIMEDVVQFCSIDM